MIIDACKPYKWIKDFPVSNVMSAEQKADVTKRWKRVLDKLDD
jgi:hypothetical protein